MQSSNLSFCEHVRRDRTAISRFVTVVKGIVSDCGRVVLEWVMIMKTLSGDDYAAGADVWQSTAILLENSPMSEGLLALFNF